MSLKKTADANEFIEAFNRLEAMVLDFSERLKWVEATQKTQGKTLSDVFDVEIKESAENESE